MEELRAFWAEEQHHPNSDIDHFLLICRLRSAVISPCALSLWKDGVCCCVLAGRIEQMLVQPRIGYLRMPRLPRRALSFIREGGIGHLGPFEADLLISKIRELLSGGVAELAVFHCLPEGSPFFAGLQSMRRHVLGVSGPRWAEHWEMTLHPRPGFLVEAMKSKHRSWFRKKARDFESAFAGRFAWRWHANTGDVTPLCQQMEQVAARTYQRGLGAGFSDDPENRARLSLFAHQGNLRVMVLEIDRRAAAFWLGVVYRGVFQSEATGYNADLGEHEIGTQIFIRLVDELAKEGVNRLDFGLGDASYKQRFGDRSRRESTVWLFGESARSVALRAYISICRAFDGTLRGIAHKVGLADRLKQAWRRRLANVENPVKTRPKPPTSDHIA